MAVPPTNKHQIPRVDGNNAIKTGPAEINAALDAIDTKIAVDDQGVAASRPVSTAPSPGKKGRWYKSTDTGVLERDHGTGWDEIALTERIADKLGLTTSSGVRRGKCIIPGGETRSSTAYGLMPTPDRVSGIVLPTDGLIAVAYEAMWQESVVGAARAAIFVGGNQLKIQAGMTASLRGPEVAPEGAINQQANMDRPLATFGAGLIGGAADTAGHAADVTTGQVVGFVGLNAGAAPRYAMNSAPQTAPAGIPLGGPCFIFAAAGTYDISVRFKASSNGSVTVKDRKLWVWTLGF